MLSRVGPRPLFWLMALACAAALAAALVSQHVYGMQPCPWCVLQRLIVALIGLSCVAGAVLAPRRLARGWALPPFALAIAGAAAALWQHFVAAASASCDLTLADKLMSAIALDLAWPEVFAPFASCADAKVNLFGVPYEFWSLALFAALAVLALAIWRQLGADSPSKG